jgi:hypothetical protein
VELFSDQADFNVHSTCAFAEETAGVKSVVLISEHLHADVMQKTKSIPFFHRIAVARAQIGTQGQGLLSKTVHEQISLPFNDDVYQNTKITFVFGKDVQEGPQIDTLLARKAFFEQLRLVGKQASKRNLAFKWQKTLWEQSWCLENYEAHACDSNSGNNSNSHIGATASLVAAADLDTSDKSLTGSLIGDISLSAWNQDVDILSLQANIKIAMTIQHNSLLPPTPLNGPSYFGHLNSKNKLKVNYQTEIATVFRLDPIPLNATCLPLHKTSLLTSGKIPLPL